MPSIIFLQLDYPLDTAEAVQQLIGCEETLSVSEATRNKDSDGEDDDHDTEDDRDHGKVGHEDAERYGYPDITLPKSLS